jgi:hypothetical protein
MAKNSKQSGGNALHLAGQLMNNSSASQIQRTLAAGVVSQAKSGKQTGEKMEAIASAALSNRRSAAATKTLAASLVSQSNSKR